jgi:hypothetical protein
MGSTMKIDVLAIRAQAISWMSESKDMLLTLSGAIRVVPFQHRFHLTHSVTHSPSFSFWSPSVEVKRCSELCAECA